MPAVRGGSVAGYRIITTTPLQDLISGLTVDGVFAKLDRLWIKAQATQALALSDLIVGATATAVNSPTFTANIGYTGEDAGTVTKYIDSNFNPSTAGGNYAQNAAHLSAWCVGNIASVNGGALIGYSDSTAGTYSHLDVTFTDGNIYARINDNPASGSQGAPATRAGHWVVNRSGAAATQIYQNGSSFGTPNATSVGLLNENVFILCDNQNNNPKYGTPNQIAMVSIGGNLSPTDVTNFYNRLRTYMTAVGVP